MHQGGDEQIYNHISFQNQSMTNIRNLDNALVMHPNANVSFDNSNLYHDIHNSSIPSMKSPIDDQQDRMRYLNSVDHRGRVVQQRWEEPPKVQSPVHYAG